EPTAQPASAITYSEPTNVDGQLTGTGYSAGSSSTQTQVLDVQTFKQQSEQVQELKSQVSQLQSEKFGNDFDVFKGLNDTPPPPQEDVHDDKNSTLTVNPNSLKL
ncbi:hypothetical protein V9N52_004155, partial [Vibrio navarrensis]